MAQPTHTPSTFSHIRNDCNECCSIKNLNPKNWEPQSARKTALYVFAVSLIALITACLIIRYPELSRILTGVFVTVAAIVTLLSFAAFVVSTIKYCKNEPGKVQKVLDEASSAIDKLGDSAAAAAQRLSEKKFMSQLETQKA